MVVCYPSGWAGGWGSSMWPSEKIWKKSLCFGASVGDACGCHVFLDGVVVVPLSKPDVRVKALDHFIGLDNNDVLCCIPHEVVIVELTCPSTCHIVIGGHLSDP